MKKYMIGGDPTANTSDELNPYKIKTPVAPNPSFVPSEPNVINQRGKLDVQEKTTPTNTGGFNAMAKKGGQVKKSKKY